MKREALRPGVLGLVVMAFAVGLGAPACEQAQCDELHDPTCWIPPVTDATADGEESDDDAPAEHDATSDASTAAGDGSTTGQ
ncbi:MAG TPA: hypothetical protein VEK07_04795 [Polyangiaceae bacterium]|nr:hypothetical protein [Polyangiaceae bacterium]